MKYVQLMSEDESKLPYFVDLIWNNTFNLIPVNH